MVQKCPCKHIFILKVALDIVPVNLHHNITDDEKRHQIKGVSLLSINIPVTYLPHKVKTQYLQIQHIVDTSSKHQISILFHVKRLCVYTFEIVDTPLSYGRALIDC